MSTLRQSKHTEKSEQTKDKILLAAKKVFSVHPYKLATTRMIADQAEVDHPLIHYHFGSKEQLFSLMASQMFQEFVSELSSWFTDMERMTAATGLPVFIDRMLDYTFSNPEIIQLTLINMAQEEAADSIPGFNYVRAFAEYSRDLFEKIFTKQASPEEFLRFAMAFSNMVIFYIGAKSSQATVVGFGPETHKYRQWVKQSLLDSFLPWLEKLLNSK